MANKYLSIEEAADFLGIPQDELTRLRESGDLRGFADRGTWKFLAEAIEEYHRSRQTDSSVDGEARRPPMTEYHIRTNKKGKSQGPFSAQQVKKLAESSRLRPENLISSDGGVSWRPAEKFRGLEFAARPTRRLTVESLQNHEKWARLGVDFSIQGFTEIDDAAAESLSKHKGTLSLGGLTSLSDAAAESLSKHRGDSLELDGLTSLSNAVATNLGKHQGESLSLGGLTSLSDAVAENLSKYAGSLHLDGLTSLSDSAAESLSEHVGHNYEGLGLSLCGLTDLSAAAAESLSKYAGWLWLDYQIPGLSREYEKKQLLAKLDGQTSLSDADAKSLSEHDGDLWLDGLTSLSDAAAEILSKHKGSLNLSGLSNLSFEAAESLSNHEGRLHLEGLTGLSDVAAMALAKHNGGLVIKLDLQPNSAAVILYESGALGLDD